MVRTRHASRSPVIGCSRLRGMRKLTNRDGKYTVPTPGSAVVVRRRLARTHDGFASERTQDAAAAQGDVEDQVVGVDEVPPERTLKRRNRAGSEPEVRQRAKLGVEPERLSGNGSRSTLMIALPTCSRTASSRFRSGKSSVDNLIRPGSDACMSFDGRCRGDRQSTTFGVRAPVRRNKLVATPLSLRPATAK